MSLSKHYTILLCFVFTFVLSFLSLVALFFFFFWSLFSPVCASSRFGLFCFHRMLLLLTAPWRFGTFSITYGIAMFLLFLEFMAISIGFYRALSCGHQHSNDTVSVKSASVLSARTNARLKLVHNERACVRSRKVVDSTNSTNSLEFTFSWNEHAVAFFRYTIQIAYNFSSRRNFSTWFLLFFYQSRSFFLLNRWFFDPLVE